MRYGKKQITVDNNTEAHNTLSASSMTRIELDCEQRNPLESAFWRSVLVLVAQENQNTRQAMCRATDQKLRAFTTHRPKAK